MSQFRVSAAAMGWFLASLALPVVSIGQEPEFPGFTYALDPCQPVVERSPGSTYDLVFDVTITTEANPSDTQGAQGWSLSIASTGLDITAITTQGTVSAPVTDNPPGLRINGFEKTEVARSGGKSQCEANKGAVSAVVLSFLEVVTLPPSGTESVARLTVRGKAPQVLGESAAASLRFFNGCAGAGGPISNVVTWTGASVQPALSDCEFEVRATGEVFRRGDPTADGKVDLSDAVIILGCKFLGEKCPGCRDAGDANDDGLMDLSDAVYILSYLFLGGTPPRPPTGFDFCGTDPTPDSLPACVESGC